MAFEQQNRLDVRLDQRQFLSQLQQQSLKLLQLSAPELEQELSAVLAVNPLLEYEETPAEAPELPPETPPETPDEAGDDARGVEEDSDEWRDELPVPPENTGDNADAPDFLQYTAAPEPELGDTLALELEVAVPPPGVRRDLCFAVVAALEADGYLRTPLADIAQNCNADADEAEAALAFVQTLDPPGVAARDLPECWRLQLARSGELSEPLKQLLTPECVEELCRNRPDRVAVKLGIPLPELGKLLSQLRNLRRAPVSVERSNCAVVPDAEIFRTPEGGFAARLTRERRRYFLSPAAEYADALDAGVPFKRKVKEAQTLLEALEFRKSTLLRLTEMLIDTQRDFLEHGSAQLRPFTEKQAAERLGFKGVSTVSRAVTGKFVATPQGVLPFKYFFSSGYARADGEQVSRRADMEKLRELIADEDPRAPASDDRLAELLNQAGHPVARRTVVKYRKLMNIPNSNLRKKLL